jgi:hypothetical protein
MMPKCLVFEKEVDAVTVAEEYADRNDLHKVNGKTTDRYYEKEIPVIEWPIVNSYSRLDYVIIPNKSIFSITTAEDLSEVADEVLSE